MEIVYKELELCCYMNIVVSVFNDVSVLLDYFLDVVVEVDMDVVFDGIYVVIGLLMQYIE